MPFILIIDSVPPSPFLSHLMADITSLSGGDNNPPGGKDTCDTVLSRPTPPSCDGAVNTMPAIKKAPAAASSDSEDDAEVSSLVFMMRQETHRHKGEEDELPDDETPLKTSTTDVTSTGAVSPATHKAPAENKKLVPAAGAEVCSLVSLLRVNILTEVRAAFRTRKPLQRPILMVFLRQRTRVLQVQKRTDSHQLPVLWYVH